MPSLRCPRCATVVTVLPGQAPVCPSCGFAGPPPAAAAAAGIPAAPPGAAPSPYAAPMAPPQAPVAEPSPWAAPAAAWVPPAADQAAMPGQPAVAGPRGKTVAPGLVVLFHIVTLGIYFFVFWWRTSREVDAASGQARAHGVTRIGVWLMVAGIATLVVVALAAIALIAGAALSEGAETYDEEQFIEDLLGAGVAILAGLLIGVLLLLAGRITILVGEYRVWKATRDLQQRLGQPRQVPAGLFLGISIAALLFGGGSNSQGGSAGDAFEGLLGFLALVAYLTIAALTQSHLNRVWQAPTAAAPVPPQSV